MWEKKSYDGGIHDYRNLYTWSAGGSGSDGTAFTVFLATLNTPPCFAGHCDWQLPTSGGNPAGSSGQAPQLESILAAPYPCGIDPCVPPAFNTGCTPGCTVTTCSCTYQGGYWATTYAASPINAWAIDFRTGLVDFLFKYYSQWVRAVR